LTGWTRDGHQSHQREKIYAILRAHPEGISVFDILHYCWELDDPVINKIKAPTVRRILNKELNQEMKLAHKVFDKWFGLLLNEERTN